MRTALFLVAGFLFMGGFLVIGKLFGEQFAGAGRVATLIFAVAWLAVAGFNMWLGVARAGYSVSDELPIFLLIFAVPVVVAVVIQWRIL